MYYVKTPWLLRQLYPTLTWQIATQQKELFLTFDDGPHPVATPFVLDTLKEFGAKATFFCIGKNVVQYPEIFKRISSEGHAIGNHTNDHLNGWKTTDTLYLDNINAADKVIGSSLFRPPYGRIKRRQARLLQPQYKIVMWDVLSGDFDTNLSAEKSLQFVVQGSRPGSIIVLHDSQKAYRIVHDILPKLLQHFAGQGYTFSRID
jgi:peptidoglycan/xylan/chitin deacetylase (PgdA/CDA1 family)